VDKATKKMRDKLLKGFDDILKQHLGA